MFRFSLLTRILIMNPRYLVNTKIWEVDSGFDDGSRPGGALQPGDEHPFATYFGVDTK
jgi:hypothetical protein